MSVIVALETHLKIPIFDNNIHAHISAHKIMETYQNHEMYIIATFLTGWYSQMSSEVLPEVQGGRAGVVPLS